MYNTLHHLQVILMTECIKWVSKWIKLQGSFGALRRDRDPGPLSRKRKPSGNYFVLKSIEHLIVLSSVFGRYSVILSAKLHSMDILSRKPVIMISEALSVESPQGVECENQEEKCKNHDSMLNVFGPSEQPALEKVEYSVCIKNASFCRNIVFSICLWS